MPARHAGLRHQSHFWRTPSFNLLVVSPLCRQVSMTSRFHRTTRAAAIAAMLTVAPHVLAAQVLTAQVLAQSDDADPEMRIQQLENQLRQLTGQNEELQYRNRQLEDRLKLLQGGAQAAPSGPPVIQPGVAALPPAAPNPGFRPPVVDQQIAAPAPFVTEPPAPGRRRGDAFDP